MPKQGEIYWLKLGEFQPSTSAFPHPHVVIEVKSDTIVFCAITTNKKKIALPGNILLKAGEANLPRQSIVDVAQVVHIRKEALGKYVGTLSKERIAEVLRGQEFVQKMMANRK